MAGGMGGIGGGMGGGMGMGSGLGMGSGFGMGGMSGGMGGMGGMRPAGLGAPQLAAAPQQSAGAPKASLEDSLMANLANLSMNGPAKARPAARIGLEMDMAFCVFLPVTGVARISYWIIG